MDLITVILQVVLISMESALPLAFDTKTFDVEAADSRAIGTRQVLTFGGNLRRNSFDISIAPVGANRAASNICLNFSSSTGIGL